MSIKVLVIAIISCVLIIDAIRYRIIYFKFKKLGIVDYKEISENLDYAETRSIKVNVKDQEEAKRKMVLLSTLIPYISELEEEYLNFLVEDLDFLLYHYEQSGLPLVKSFGNNEEENKEEN